MSSVDAVFHYSGQSEQEIDKTVVRVIVDQVKSIGHLLLPLYYLTDWRILGKELSMVVPPSLPSNYLTDWRRLVEVLSASAPPSLPSNYLTD